MPRSSPIAAIEKLLTTLLTERQACARRLAEIDGLFARYGITLGGAPRPAAGAATAAQMARLANLTKARAAKAAKAGARPAAPAPAAGRVKRHYSAAARRAMAEASKRRWATYHAQQAQAAAGQ